ncbi:MAG: redox-sensing transcriptional repressor Rex [Gemmatimonadota bacterium]
MKKVSSSTVARLSLYLRVLEDVATDDVRTLSSGELAKRCATTAAQVRKDLSVFGTFGKRGTGYPVPELVAQLRAILGLGRTWRVALVGAGRIGAALLGYADFRRQGFLIDAVFDADDNKVGRSFQGHRVRTDRELESAVAAGEIDIAIVAVPAEAAQDVVDRVVAAGVRAVLNFAPVKLRVPAGVALKNVNMAAEMEGLSFALANQERPTPRRAAS